MTTPSSLASKSSLSKLPKISVNKNNKSPLQEEKLSMIVCFRLGEMKKWSKKVRKLVEESKRRSVIGVNRGKWGLDEFLG
jgi:hypothetical protein